MVEEAAFFRDRKLPFRGVLPAVLVPGCAEGAEEFRLGVAGFGVVGGDAVDAEGVVGLDVLSRERRHVGEGPFAHPGEHGAAFGGGDVDTFGVRHVRPFG